MEGCCQPQGPLEAFWDLERYLDAAGAARAGLAEVERGCEAKGREMLRLSLQGHVDARGHGERGEALVVYSAEGPVRLGYKKLSSRAIVAIFGELKVTRMGYYAPGVAAIYPLDAELCLPGRCYSYELQRRLVRLAVCSPFEEACETLAALCGVVVPKRSAELILKEAAVDFDDFYATRAATAADIKDCPEQILVGGIDCKGIPMVKDQPAPRVYRLRPGQKPNKKKMATVATVFCTAPYFRSAEEVIASLFGPKEPAAAKPAPSRPADRRVWASLTSTKDSFIDAVRDEMARRDPGHSRTWVIVTDGERALQRRVASRFNGATLVLDFFHALDKLWDAGHVLAEGAALDDFVKERAQRILCGQVGQVVKGLRQIVTKRGLKGQRAKAVRSVANYLYANRERMRYDLYLAKGWPIGSGSVEAGCKNLVRDRFERTGMRWRPQTAEAMLKLRATYLSADLDTYWEYHVRQDQQRLYHTGTWEWVPQVDAK